MSVLRGKKVLLGITGGIAAYKAPLIARLLIREGAQVQVVMTPSAKEFVTPLTLSTLTDRPVLSSFTDEEDENAVWNNHVALGIWADFMLIAPATANTLSKMASATSDNLLLATYLSAKCPVYFAPAMDLDMYKHPATLKTIQQLESFGNVNIPAASGFLASGLHGEGRMQEPEYIVQFLKEDISNHLPLRSKKFLISAGPTYESIDPVRFIGNHASGKMGFALANQAAMMGAEVILVTGPTHEKTEYPNIEVVPVISAKEMYTSCMERFNDVEVAIMSAAVSDYKPTDVAAQKIKKKTGNLTIQLSPTTDILAQMGVDKTHQFLVGFALETENELEHAFQKLKKKNLDAIVLNSLNDQGAGFGTPTNKITFIDATLKTKEFELKPKNEVALDIITEIIARL
jgi:phosphopantothenoylcysteine decarboxylase/phosphopantothenate--cysteine ligase